MCLPSLPVEDFVQAVKAIVSFDQDWVPHAEGTSLYIRPFVIATEPHLGVRKLCIRDRSYSINPVQQMSYGSSDGHPHCHREDTEKVEV